MIKALRHRLALLPSKNIDGTYAHAKMFYVLNGFKISWIGHLSTFFSKGFGFIHRMPVGIFCLKKVKVKT